MHLLFPPYRTGPHFTRRTRGPGHGLPVPWAVPVRTVRAARDLLDQLRDARMRAGEVVVAGDGRVYVRWFD
jgi:hypothetical protein